jgi:hypothetical protein
MPILRTGECGNYRRNWPSEHTWKVGFAGRGGRERERFASRYESSIDARLVSTWVDPQKSLVGHQDTNQAVKDKGRRPIVQRQTLVAKSGRNVLRAQEGDEKVALCVAQTGTLAENLGSSQSDLTPPGVPGVSDGVAHPIEKDGDGVKIIGPGGEARGELANCSGLPVDDVAGREKWSAVEERH